MAKNKFMFGQGIGLRADASGNPPDSIHVMSVGHWHAPWHGNFEMTPDDLAEMIVNFEEGVGSVAGSKKLPVNYGHDISGKAAGWVTALRLENGGDELWADISWTPYGTQMLADNEFRYISPEWNPRSFPYQDPENEDTWINNVFTGAGLTNIPLFKKLKPIMASMVGSSDTSKQTQGGDMDLTQVRAKKPEDLSDEEKTFLDEHKTELTDDERTTFGLVDEDAEAKAKAEQEAKDKAEKDAADKAAAEAEASKQASANGGLSASQITQLQADAKAGREAQQELLKSRLTASIDAVISRGAIKSDQREAGVKVLMAASNGNLTELLTFLQALPDNALLASEIGNSAGVSASAQDELSERAANAVKESDGKLSYSDAMKGLLASDSKLRDRVNAERSNQTSQS